MNEFFTWTMLQDFTSFVAVVFMIVEFTKEIPILKKVPTKYWSAFVSFMLMITVQLHAGTFEIWDLVIYAITSMGISLTANGAYNFNRKNMKED